MARAMRRSAPALLLPAAAVLALLFPLPSASAETPASPVGPVGVVRPSREVVLKASTAGVLAEVLVAEGQRVEAGQPLARMDDAVQAARVAAARVRASATADADELAAAAAATRRELTRTREASATGAAPAWELEAAETALTIAEARHAAALQRRELAAAELAVEEALLARHRIIAPFTAVVLAVEADAGASLTPADPLLRLAALDPLEATVHVPVSHHRALGPDRVGTEVEAAADAAGHARPRRRAHRLAPRDRPRQPLLPLPLPHRQPRQRPAGRLHRGARTPRRRPRGGGGVRPLGPDAGGAMEAVASLRNRSSTT